MVKVQAVLGRYYRWPVVPAKYRSSSDNAKKTFGMVGSELPVVGRYLGGSTGQVPAENPRTTENKAEDCPGGSTGPGDRNFRPQVKMQKYLKSKIFERGDSPLQS